MKITRRQLRKLISESMYDPMYGMKSLEEPYKSKIMSVLDNPDSSPEDRKQFHHLADTIGDYKDPRPGMPDDSLAGVKAQNQGYLKDGAQQIEVYLPGFLKLPAEMIDTVTEFVLLSKNPTLHMQLDEDRLEDTMGKGAYFKAIHYKEMIKPENAEIVAIVDGYRRYPRDHDEIFYNIYSVTNDGTQIFARIDPQGFNDAQTGFHEGFREEYQKVTTDPAAKIDSYTAEKLFIRMVRALRPDHKEFVI